MPLPTTESGYLARLRVLLLDDILLALALISTPGLALSLSRIPVMGWLPIFVLQITVVLTVWTTWALRRRLPYGVRVTVVMGCLGSVGIGGYLQHGPAAVAGQFIVLFLIVGAMCLKGRSAVLAGIGLLLALSATGFAATQGWMDFSLDYARFARDPTTWALLFVSIAGYGGAIAMVVARLLDTVDHHERELAAANAALVKRNQAAESADRLKTEILANLSHEFRTPLNGILGMADLLQMSDDDPERQGWIAELQGSAKRLDHVLGRMLDFVALGEGKAPLRTGPFDLGELVAATITAFRPRAEAQGLTLRCETDPALIAHVAGDGSRLRQMLGELVGNALNHTAQGEICCRIERTAAPAGDPRQWVRIAVCDTGSGIAPDMLERIFEPFVQVDGSTTRNVGGNGIGLPLCRRIAALMEGTLTATNAPGGGSCFTLVLPFALPR